MNASVDRSVPASASELLALVSPFGAGVEGRALVFALDLPVGLLPALSVLHTGVRAALTGRRWFGCGTTRKAAAALVLDLRAPIPPDVWLLTVEGDERWDRIRSDARLDLPRLFVPAV